jgi:hypothetical protein
VNNGHVHCTEEELLIKITNMGYIQVEGDLNRYIRRNANGIHKIVINH